MSRIMQILAVVVVLGVIGSGLAFISNRERSAPLHDMDVFKSNDQVRYIVDMDSSNLRELLREFDYTYFQKVSNPDKMKMFYVVSVVKEEVYITRFEREFDKEIYTFHVEPADEYYFITDMDADINSELVSHAGFELIDASVLRARHLRSYKEMDDGIVMNPTKILINFELLEKQAEFTIGIYPNIDLKQYTVKIMKEKGK